MISDGTIVIQAAMWDAARQLLQVGDVPYDANLFSHLSAGMQTQIIRDRMRCLAGTECLFDLVGRNFGDQSFKSEWCVYAISRPVAALPHGLHAPLPDSPPHPERHVDYADVPIYCASPEHNTYQGNSTTSISAMCPPRPSADVLCLSSDSEYLSPDSFDLLPSTLSASPHSEESDSSDVLSLGAAFAGLGVRHTGESVQSTTALPETDYRSAYVDHLIDCIAKAEHDILMRELELRECKEYLEKLRSTYIHVDRS